MVAEMHTHTFIASRRGSYFILFGELEIKQNGGGDEKQ